MKAAIDTEESPLQSLLFQVRKAAVKDRVTVSDLLGTVGETSFSTLLFLVAFLMVTPLSGIPTAPTISAAVIFLIVAQRLSGRKHLWLPNWIADRGIDSDRFCRALAWADRPARVLDRMTHSRLHQLARGAGAVPALLLVLGIAATWPLLEILPLFTSVCAVGVAFVALGLMTRDGLFVLAGYAWFGLLAGAAMLVI